MGRHGQRHLGVDADGATFARSGTLRSMSTTRPRYQITETPEVAQALDRAAQRWPGEPRSKLLRRLIIDARRSAFRG